MVLNIVLIFIILFLLLILTWVWPPDSPWAPWWRTDKKTARAICKLSDLTKGDLVYDLGSGDGTALIVAAKEFGVKGVGIEIDPLRNWISKLRARNNGVSDKVKIIRKNFFEQNIKDADVIFVYLVPVTLKKLLPKFKKELKKGTRIVSYVYEMDLPLKKEDKKNRLRLYII